MKRIYSIIFMMIFIILLNNKISYAETISCPTCGKITFYISSYTYSDSSGHTRTGYCTSTACRNYNVTTSASFQEHSSSWQSEGYGSDKQHYLKCSKCNGTWSYGYHSYGAWYDATDTYHRRDCTGCNGKSYGTEDHYDNDSSGSCDVCGHAMEISHTHTYGAWSPITGNSAFCTQHQRTCTFSGCTASETESCVSDNGQSCETGSYCTICGGVMANPKGHAIGSTWYHNSTKCWAYCSNGCGLKMGEADHMFLNASTPCTCVRCQQTYHNYTETVTKEATCIETGTKDNVCSRCGDNSTETIAKDPNNHAKTTTTKSYSKNSASVHTVTEKYDCCQAVKSTTTEAHDWDSGKVTKEATCTTNGTTTYTCNDCSETKTETITSPGHDYENFGNCTAQKCSVCSNIIGEQTHAWGNWTYSDGTYHKKTCSNSGCRTGSTSERHTASTVATCLKTAYCNTCSSSFGNKDSSNHEKTTTTKSYSKNTASVHTVTEKYDCCKAVKSTTTEAHDWNSGNVTTAATCTENGVKTYTCNDCSETKTETITKLGHDYTSKVTTTATCISKGERTYTCKNDSSHTYTEDIAKNPNNHASTTETTYQQNDDATHYVVETYKCCGVEASKTTQAHYDNNSNGLCDACNYVMQVSSEVILNGGSDYYITYGDPAGTIRYTYGGNGTTTISVGDTSIASATLNTSSKTITITPKKVGKTTLTINTAETSTVFASSDSIYINVETRKLTVPTQKGSLTYTGNSQSPSWNNYDTVYMTLGGTTSGTNATSYNATFTLDDTTNTTWSDGTTAAKNASWTIGAKSIAGSDITMTLSSTSYTYNGSAKKPTVTVTDTTRNKTLTKDTDYTVSYSSNINAGTATAKITGKGNYKDTNSKTFTIAKKTLTVPSQSGSLTFTGNPQSPSWNNYDTTYMTLGGTKSGTDADSYDATFTLTDTANTQWSGNTTAAKTVSWTIGAKSIAGSDITMTLGTTSYTYSGSAKKPTVTVKDTTRNVTLTSGTDYTVSYSNNIAVGSATATVTGKGNYKDTNSETFTISIRKLTVPTQSGSLTFTGNSQSPSWNNYDTAYMTIGGTTSGTSAASYNATFTLDDTTNTQWSDGTTAAKTVEWTIGQKSIAGSDITITLSSESYTYDGSEKKPTVTVTDTTRNKTLTSGTDYTVSYSNNKVSGTARVTITGKGNYKDTNGKDFTISIRTLTVPSQSGTLTYNDSNQTPNWDSNYDTKYMTVSGETSGKNAGTYDVTFALVDKTNTQWSGGSTANQPATWKINQKAPSLSVSPTTTTIPVGGTASATITYDGDGTLGASSSNTNVATVNRTNKSLTITGVSEGTATITVSAGAGTNYKVATNATITVTVCAKPTTPTITVKNAGGATISSGNWSTSNLTITIAGSTLSGPGTIGYQYSYDGTTWNNYTGAITYSTDTNNTTIYARAYNTSLTTQTSSSSSFKIRLDITAPTGTTIDSAFSSETITVEAINVNGNVSGVKEYEFYLDGTLKTTQTAASYTYTGLQPGTSYTVGIKVRDNAGNVTSLITKSITTSVIPSNITLTPSTTDWVNYPVTVTIGWPSTTYIQQIKVGSGSWQEYTGTTYDIPSNTTIYARLSDGVSHGSAVSLDIENIDTTVPTVSATSSSITYGTKISFTGNDNLSGINAYKITTDNVAPTSGWTTVAASTSVSVTETSIRDVDEYYIWVKDQAGNVSASVKVTVNQKAISSTSITITLNPTSYTYDATEKKPSVTVKDGTTTLSSTNDYSVSYSNNVNAGTAKVTITGKGNYTGTNSANFTINPATPTITLENKAATYTKSAISIDAAKVTGVTNGTIPAGTITYKYYTDSNCTTETNKTNSGATESGAAPVRAGKYYVKATIAKEGNYASATSSAAVLTINSKPLTELESTISTTTYTYNASARTQTVTIKDGSYTLIAGTDYTVGYTNNVNAGKATVTVTGKENYSGTLTSNFTINSKDLTVIPNANQYKYFGKADPTLTYTYSGQVSGQTPGDTGALSRVAGEAVGNYAINIGSLALANNGAFIASNYNLVFSATTVNFEIKTGTDSFVTEWIIPSNETTIVLPIPAFETSYGSNNYIVDWGDGTTNTYDESANNPTHKYSKAGTYLVKISGEINSFGYFGTTAPTSGETAYTFTQYVTGLKQWGEVNCEAYGFATCANLAGTIPTPSANSFINVNNFNQLFFNCSKLTGSIPSGLFTEATKAVGFNNTFNGCTGLTGAIPATLFNDATSAQGFYATFANCTGLTSIPSGLFKNTTNATGYEMTFYNCTGLKGNIPTQLFGDASKVTSFANMFKRCSNLDGTIPSDLFATATNATNFYGVFLECNKLSGNIPSGLFANTTKAEQMGLVFSRCRSLTGTIPESLFANTPNVLSYESTFNECVGLTGSIPANLFANASKATQFNATFYNCTGLTGDIPGALFENATSATNFGGVFTNCSGLTGGEMRISTANNPNIETMFLNCSNITTLIFGENFKNINGQNMFNGCSKLSRLILCNDAQSTSSVGTLSALTTIALPSNTIVYVPTEAAEGNYESAWNGIIAANRIEPILGLYGEKETSLSPGESYDESATVAGVKSITGSDITPTELSKYGYKLTQTSNDVDINTIGIYYVTYELRFNGVKVDEITRTVKVREPILMAESNARNGYLLGYTRYTGDLDLTVITRDMIKTITIINTDEETVPTGAIAAWDVSKENNGSVMAHLVGSEGNYNLYIAGAGGVRASEGSYLFSYYPNCTSIVGLEKMDTSLVTNMSNMFRGCNSLSSLNLSNFTTDNVTDMNSMFTECKSLESLDVSSFNTNNVTDMGQMFGWCNNLKNIEFGEFKTQNVTEMYSMFVNCNNLTSLDLSSFNTSNVTSMNQMFSDCHNLISLDLSMFDTSKVKSMEYMFRTCTNLTSIDVSSFNTANVKNMNRIFFYCENLTELNLDNFNTANVTNMEYAFAGCNKLTLLLLGKDFDRINGTGMFNSTPQLETIISTSASVMSIVDSTGATVDNGLKTSNAAAVIYVPNGSVELLYEQNGAYASILGFTTNEDSERLEPMLELIGEANIVLAQGESFVDPGYTVAGFEKKDISKYQKYGYTVTTKDSDPIDSLGSFKRTYTLTRNIENSTTTIDILVRVIKAGVAMNASISTNGTSGIYAKAGQIITLEIRTNQELQSNPIVTIAGQSATVVKSTEDSLLYTATITVADNTPEGNVEFLIKHTTFDEDVSVSTTYDDSIAYIDRTLPTVDKPESISITENTIKVKSNQTDTASAVYNSGISKVEYAIKESAKTVWGAYQSSDTFNNLTLGMEYDIKTRTTDIAGNISESEVLENVSTKAIEPDDIVFGVDKTEWTNQTVTVTIYWPETTLDKYYKLNSGEWTKTTEEETIVVTTEYGDTVVAKLVDNGTNEVSNAITIYNIDKISPTVTATVESAWTNKPKTITATGNDTMPGSGINGYYITNDESKVPTINEFVSNQSTTQTYTKDMDTYYIWVVDLAGNICETPCKIVVDKIDKEKPVVTIIPPEGEFNSGDEVRYVIEIAEENPYEIDTDQISIIGGVIEEIIVNDDGTIEVTVTVGEEAEVILTAEEGLVTDIANNKNDITSDNSLVVDNEAPVLNGATINNGAATTDGVGVTVQIDATGADWMFVTNEDLSQTEVSKLSNGSESGWLPYADETLHELTQGDGLKIVYVWVKDDAGNITGPVRPSITLTATVIGNKEDIVDENGSQTTTSTGTNKTTLKFKVTDTNFYNSTINANTIVAYVEGTKCTTAKFESVNGSQINNGITYQTVVSDVSGDGKLAIGLNGASVKDMAGNTLSTTQVPVNTQITVDNTAPSLTVTSNKVTVNDENLVGVMLNGKLILTANGSTTITIPTGAIIKAIDKAGNTTIVK